MFLKAKAKPFTFIYNSTVGVVLAAFIINSSFLPQKVYAQSLSLPSPGSMLKLSAAFEPAVIKGMKIDPNDPLLFDFLMDPGQVALSDSQKRVEYNKLIKYFLAALTTPEQDMWVNLSPYEHARMIAKNLGQTEMGRDMLAQDYILKQLSASLIYPEKALGKKFWNEIYERLRLETGSTRIPVNTFNKIWIIPDTASIFEKGNVVVVVSARLKVLLDEDYLSLDKHANYGKMGLNSADDARFKNISRSSSDVVRTIVLPAIEKEVNEGRNFANIRQIYYSLILASWFKQRIKMHVLSKIYVNKNKNAGVALLNPKENEQIYKDYLKAFKLGVFNYIKEDVDPLSRQAVPRKYFSGGQEWSRLSFAMNSLNAAMRTTNSPGNLYQRFDVCRAQLSPIKRLLSSLVLGAAILHIGGTALAAGGNRDELISSASVLKHQIAVDYKEISQWSHGSERQVHGHEIVKLMDDIKGMEGKLKALQPTFSSTQTESSGNQLGGVAIRETSTTSTKVPVSSNVLFGQVPVPAFAPTTPGTTSNDDSVIPGSELQFSPDSGIQPIFNVVAKWPSDQNHVIVSSISGSGENIQSSLTTVLKSALEESKVIKPTFMGEGVQLNFQSGIDPHQPGYSNLREFKEFRNGAPIGATFTEKDDLGNVYQSGTINGPLVLVNGTYELPITNGSIPDGVNTQEVVTKFIPLDETLGRYLVTEPKFSMIFSRREIPKIMPPVHTLTATGQTALSIKSLQQVVLGAAPLPPTPPRVVSAMPATVSTPTLAPTTTTTNVTSIFDGKVNRGSLIFKNGMSINNVTEFALDLGSFSVVVNYYTADLSDKLLATNVPIPEWIKGVNLRVTHLQNEDIQTNKPSGSLAPEGKSNASVDPVNGDDAWLQGQLSVFNVFVAKHSVSLEKRKALGLLVREYRSLIEEGGSKDKLESEKQRISEQIKSMMTQQQVASDVGGIDFDAQYLQLNMQGDPTIIPVPQQYQWLLNAPIAGFTPQIVGIQSGPGYTLAFFKGLLTPDQVLHS